MTNPPSWQLKVRVTVIVSVLALLVLSIVAEITVRYRERHRANTPEVMPFLYYRHKTLGFALVHNYNYFGWVNINPQGFRGSRPVALIKEPGVFRVLAVGGSTTFDTEVSADSAAWPARLEHWLHLLAPESRIEVINAGVPGYNMTQDLIRLETELGDYRPDLIVLYQGHNDLFQNLRVGAVGSEDSSDGAAGSRRPSEVATITPWGRWLEQNSLFYAKLMQRIKVLAFARLRTHAGAEQRALEAAPLADAGAERFGRLVSQYLAVAQAQELQVVVPELVQLAGVSVDPTEGVQRVWSAAVPFAAPDAVLLGYQRYNQTLQEMSARYRVPFLPMAHLDIAGPSYYAEGDPIHFNDQGADRFAEGLARSLVARGLVSSVPR